MLGPTLKPKAHPWARRRVERYDVHLDHEKGLRWTTNTNERTHEPTWFWFSEVSHPPSKLLPLSGSPSPLLNQWRGDRAAERAVASFQPSHSFAGGWPGFQFESLPTPWEGSPCATFLALKGSRLDIGRSGDVHWCELAESHPLHLHGDFATQEVQGFGAVRGTALSLSPARYSTNDRRAWTAMSLLLSRLSFLITLLHGVFVVEQSRIEYWRRASGSDQHSS